MPPQLATAIVILFILYLFIIDGKRKDEDVSGAVYLPFFWFLFAGSRFLSQWLSLGATVESSAQSYFEGSPIDRLVFLLLIVGGIVVLQRRRIAVGSLLRQNLWVVLYFAFGLLSVLWSDYPLTSMKRLTKAIGNPLMALVLLTEKRPDRAIGLMIRRVAYLLLPLSVLFIKYYPHLGREYHVTGLQMSMGVTTSKNQLGQLCLLCGIYFAWELLVRRQDEVKSVRRRRLPVLLGVSAMTVWLLYMANSMTSIVTLGVAVVLLLLSRLPRIVYKPSRILTLGLSIAGLLVALQLALNLSLVIIVHVLGRDPSLTTRVPMWYDLMGMVKNPIVGFGYESFWLGERLSSLWQRYGRLHQAHNGYLEVYLNLGAIGLILILGTLISGFVKVKKGIDTERKFCILRLVFLVVVVIHNWTEASFYGVSNMWLMMFLAVLEIPRKWKAWRGVIVRPDPELVV